MDLMNLLNKLNNEQKAAAMSLLGPSMIVAGPGSGKTFTLVVRTANMIANGIPANNIVLFTFTKKAANEIKERITNTIGPEANKITVGTYHSVCNRILRQYSNAAGLTRSFSILDTDDCKKIMKDIIKKSGYNLEADKMLSKVSDYKGSLVTTTDALRNANSTYEYQQAEIYKLYSDTLIRQNSVDFDDLIFKTVRIMTNYPQIKEEINNRYQYVVAKALAHITVM